MGPFCEYYICSSSVGGSGSSGCFGFLTVPKACHLITLNIIGELNTRRVCFTLWWIDTLIRVFLCVLLPFKSLDRLQQKSENILYLFFAIALFGEFGVLTGGTRGLWDGLSSGHERRPSVLWCNSLCRFLCSCS